ncbi:MAG: hypothetical protein RBS73_00250 [Prolixibacteraceae bacterium]|jgi:hypothetical protein|nr:hypothetical protein [Prolixibacteraceae bacterium]
MKLKVNFILIAIVFSCFSSHSADYTKKLRKAYPKGDVAALSISNKYGTITINDAGGDSVTIDVTIVVESADGSKARQLLDQISVGFSKSGKTAMAETKISSDFKTRQNFSINYKVNIPADRDLDISNKYGNLSVNKLEARGKFDIAYGNITAEIMKAPENEPILLDLSYGRADFQEVNKLNAAIGYSKLFLGETRVLKLVSKYSTIQMNEVGELQTESKYDGFSIDEAGSITAESKYTHYNVDELKKKLVLDSAYGNITVDEVADGFETIDIDSSYGGIKLGLDERAYTLYAECSYCGVDYPQNLFKGNREKDNQNLKIDGKIGNGTANVRIISRYGGVKLTE